LIPPGANKEGRKWFRELAQVFSARVMLLLVLDVVFYAGIFGMDDHAKSYSEPFAFAVVSYIWFGFVGLQLLTHTGVVAFDQVLEAKRGRIAETTARTETR